jgi:hypothetical protein
MLGTLAVTIYLSFEHANLLCKSRIVPFPLSMAKQYAIFNNRKRAPNNFKFFTRSIRISYSGKVFGA